MYAHRYAWTLSNGPIPPKIEVCHHCDNPPCVKVSHLFLGTQRDNLRDMTQKGRGEVPDLKRERHPGAKLTEAQVVEIRARLATKTESHRSIAQTFGVSRPTVTAINTRRNWQ